MEGTLGAEANWHCMKIMLISRRMRSTDYKGLSGIALPGDGAAAAAVKADALFSMCVKEQQTLWELFLHTCRFPIRYCFKQATNTILMDEQSS